MDRYFCFRFDVDTHRCVRRGVPSLLDLGRSLDARFTFFVNMGRAISRGHALRRLLRPSTLATAASGTAAKLSPIRKLGPWDTLLAALVNPAVGAGSPKVLRRALAEGHEIGLHGGANHAIWQAEADAWDPDRLRREIREALQELEGITGSKPEGFASPTWKSPGALPDILESLGFDYMADSHGPDHPALAPMPGTELVNVRTDLTGEPGGVAYLEHLRARGQDDDAIREDFRRRAVSDSRLVVVYDHPYFAGIQELDLVGALVEIARTEGREVVTLGEAVHTLRTGA